MAIWTSEIKELEKLYESIKGQLPDLEKELGQLIHFDDPNVLMLYSRRCLEVIISDLCECELKRPRKTEPLKGIIDKLHKEDKVPSHIITSMHGLNDLSTYGTHPKDFDPEQVKPVLNNLDIIIKWYLKYKETRTETKTKPDEEIKHEIKSPEDLKKSIQIPKKRLIGILSGILFIAVIVVAVLLFTNIIGSGKQTKELEKSIAVLPFINDSPDQENTYFINGIMEEILNNLQTIKDFRVISRTSVEQFRSTVRPALPEIAKKLEVNYIVEGSGQKYGNKFVLRVQLIAATNERHLWARSYEQEIRETNDIIRIQSQVAQSIAAELKVTMTPEEKQLIERTPSQNLTAYDFYNRGKDEVTKYYSYESNKATVQKAKDFFNKALAYDSTFARAYSGLAEIYGIEHYSINESYYSENWLDSILILADMALRYDDHLADAYSERGFYYWQSGKIEQSIAEYHKALKYNPNYSHAYKILGRVLYAMDYDHMDWVKALEYCHKAVSLERGEELPLLLRNLGEVYGGAGFPEKGKYYYDLAFKLDGDTTRYLWSMAEDEASKKNYKKATELFKKCYVRDSTNIYLVQAIAYNYCESGQYSESLKYIKKLERILESSVLYSGMKGIGYIYWLNGYKIEAEQWFNKQKKLSEESLKMGRFYSVDANYDLAAIYAFSGEKEKAYENLRIISKIRVCPPYLLGGIKTDSMFNGIRNEPEFRKIASELESKYQAEHERVKKWLEETGQL